MNSQIPQLIASQQNYFQQNKTKPVKFRINQLKKLFNIIKENEADLYKAIELDFKKSKFDTYTTELAPVYIEIKEAIRKIEKWTKTRKVRTNLVNLPAKSYIIPEPLGVSLIIGAWNYPYNLTFSPVVAAIAAGCTVVLKPSELASNTSAVIHKIISNNFPTKYFAVVEGGVFETQELLKQKFDKIFFTGSVAVGKIVYQEAAKNLIPVTLELGGKSPAFITENCNIAISAKRLIWAKFLNAGQTCIAPDYVLVHKSIKNIFLEQLVKEIKKSAFSIDNGNYVQIINKRNFERIISLINKEKIYYGGESNIDKLYIQPTIMTDINFDDAVMQDEIFGPILPILEYAELTDAIIKVKQRPRPLSCYIFTNNTETKKRILNEISFGGGCINDAIMHIGNNHLPFGGVGNSGIGSYHGEAGFKAFSHYKSILEKNTYFEPNVKYSPHTPSKLKLIKILLGF